MGNLRNLAGQTAIYGISSIGTKLLNFLLLPYLTIVVMPPGQYGEVVDLYSVMPFVLVLLTMGMEIGFFRFASMAGSPEEKKNVFQTAWGAVTLVSVVFFTAVSLFCRPLAGALKYGDTPSYIVVSAAILMFDAVGALPFARLREQGRALKYVMIKLAGVVINIVLCLFFFSVMPRLGGLSPLYDPSYNTGYFLISNLAASFATLLMLYPAYRGFRPCVDRMLLRRILVYSLPLLVSGLAGVINEFADRQFIKWLLPGDMAKTELGIYGAVTKLGAVLYLFVQMYRYAAEPFFLGSFKKDEFRGTNALAMKYFIMAGVAIFLGITLFRDLFALLVGTDFREGMHILPLVLASNMCSGVILNLSFWYKQSGQTRYAVIITGAGLVAISALCMLFVPKFGYAGAAWARFACEIVMVAVSYALMRRHYPINYDLPGIGIYLLLGGALYGASLWTRGLAPVIEIPANLLLLLVFAAYAVKAEKIDIRALFRSVIKRKKYDDKGN